MSHSNTCIKTLYETECNSLSKFRKAFDTRSPYESLEEAKGKPSAAKGQQPIYLDDSDAKMTDLDDSYDSYL